jgi:anaerobic selenocysteine-containing dehydrogenase
MGKSDKFPYVGTTYRLTEHFHYWTKHALLNAIAQPEQFVEIGEKLAEKKGIQHGDTVKVSSNRGYIKAKAVVTKRIRTAAGARPRGRHYRHPDPLGLRRGGQERLYRQHPDAVCRRRQHANARVQGVPG